MNNPRNEQDVKKRLDKLIGYRAHLSYIESHATANGIPDVNYCYRRYEGTIELKHAFRGVPKFRPAQPAWIIERCRHGGRVFIFAWIEGQYCIASGAEVLSLKTSKSSHEWKNHCLYVWPAGTLTLGPLLALLMSNPVCLDTASLDLIS